MLGSFFIIKILKFAVSGAARTSTRCSVNKNCWRYVVLRERLLHNTEFDNSDKNSGQNWNCNNIEFLQNILFRWKIQNTFVNLGYIRNIIYFFINNLSKYLSILKIYLYHNLIILNILKFKNKLELKKIY